MKKSILLFALAVCGLYGTSQAQDAVPNDNFVNQHLKAESHDFTAELGLQGGLNNLDFKLNEGDQALLRGRYFFNDKWAGRLGLAIGVDHNTKNFYDLHNASNVGTQVDNTTNFLLNLGFERHFKGTNRLSPYVGADLLLGAAGQHTTLTNTDGTNYIGNVSAEQKGPGSFSIGVRGVFGADFYFAKHVYLGAEAGLGFLSTMEGKTTSTLTTGGVTHSVTTKSAGNSFELNPSVITGVRIGFVF